MKLGKKGSSTVLKRKPAPRFWPIHRKEFIYTVNPSPGPHSLKKCLPLSVILRDILEYAQTRKEAKTIVSQGLVYIDGKIRYNDDFPVGLMDVLSIPDDNKHFRLLPSKKGLFLHPIDEKEATFKLCRIENKTVVKKGHISLSLHDGSNIFLKRIDPDSNQKSSYDPFDILKISLPNRKVLDHIKMKKTFSAVIIGGKNIGKFGKITNIEKAKGKKRKNILVTIEDKRFSPSQSYQTTLNLLFILGKASPLITVQEGP